MVQHVHIQPNVTNASTTMLIPNNALRADVALDKPSSWDGKSSLLQELAPEHADELFT
jgi:hypothetical protein